MSEAVNDEWNNVVDLFRELRKLLDNCNREAEHSWAIIDKVKRSASIITLELEDLEREISDIIVSNDETSYIGIEPYSDHLLSSLRCKRNINQDSSHEKLEQLEKCEFNIDFDKIGDCKKLDTIKTWNFCCFLDEDSRVSNEQMDILKNIKAPFYITPQNETPNNNLNFVQTLNLDSHPEDVIKSLCSPQKYYETLKFSLQNNLDRCLTLIPKKDGESTNDIETIITSNYNSEYVTEIDGDSSESDSSNIKPLSQFFNGDQVVIRNPVYYTSTDPKCCYNYCYEWQMFAPTENYCYNALTECIDPNCTHTTKGCNIFRSQPRSSNEDEIEQCSGVAQEAKIVKYCEFSDVTVIEGNKTVRGSIKSQIDENTADDEIGCAPSEVNFIATVIPADKTPPGNNKTRIQIPQRTIARPVQKNNETTKVAFAPTHKPPQATPGYRPQQTTPGYKPPQNTPQTTPGYRPQQTTPGNIPQQTTSGYKPTQATPGYKPPQTTGYKPPQATPGYKPLQTTPGQKTPAGYKPPSTTAGYKPPQTTPGYRSQQTTPGNRPQQTTPGYNKPPTPGYNKPPTPGYNKPPTPGYNKPPTPGYNKPTTTPGYNKPTTTPGYNKPTTTPGYNKPPTTPGYNKPPTTPGYKPSQPPPGTKSNMQSVPVPQKPKAVPQTRPELQHTSYKPAYSEQETSKVPKMAPESIKKESPYRRNEFTKSKSVSRDDVQPQSNISQKKGYSDPQIHTDEDRSKSQSVCKDNAQPRRNISQNKGYSDPQIHTDEERSKSRSVHPDNSQPRSNNISQNKGYYDPLFHKDDSGTRSRSFYRDDVQSRNNVISQNKGYSDPQIQTDEERSKSRSVHPDNAQPRSNNISQNKGYNDPQFHRDDSGTRSRNFYQDDVQSRSNITPKKGQSDPQMHTDEEKSKSRSVCLDDVQPRSNISQKRGYSDQQINRDEEPRTKSQKRYSDQQISRYEEPRTKSQKGYSDQQINRYDEPRIKSQKGYSDQQINRDEEPRTKSQKGYSDQQINRYDEPRSKSQKGYSDQQINRDEEPRTKSQKGYSDQQINRYDEPRTKSQKRYSDQQNHPQEDYAEDEFYETLLRRKIKNAAESGRSTPDEQRYLLQDNDTYSPNKPRTVTPTRSSKSKPIMSKDKVLPYYSDPLTRDDKQRYYTEDGYLATPPQKKSGASTRQDDGYFATPPQKKSGASTRQEDGYFATPPQKKSGTFTRQEDGYFATPPQKKSGISTRQENGYFTTPPQKHSGAFTREDFDDVSQGKIEPRKQLVPSTRQNEEPRSKSRSVCRSDAQPRSNTSQNRGYSDQQNHTSNISKQISSKPQTQRVPPTGQELDEESQRISSKPQTQRVPPTRQGIDDIPQRITSPTKQELDEELQRISSKSRKQNESPRHFDDIPPRITSSPTRQDFDDVPQRKIEPRKQLVPSTSQDIDDIPQGISSKTQNRRVPPTRQDFDDISQRITSPTRRDEELQKILSKPRNQLETPTNHDDISRRITSSPTRHELDEVSQGISSIVDNENRVNKNYSSQMVINKNYFDDDPGGTNGNNQSQFRRPQDQQDRVNEQPSNWTWNPYTKKMVYETDSKTQSNKQYVYKISSTSTTELGNSDLRKIQIYQNDKKDGPMAILKCDLLERSPIIQNKKNPNNYHSSTKYEGANFQIEEIKATVGPDNCATVKLLNADNEVIKTSRVCFSDDVGKQLFNNVSRGSQTEESMLLKSLHLFSKNNINTAIETRELENLLSMNKLLITSSTQCMTENRGPEISTQFKTVNHPTEISTQYETENHATEISTQYETENNAPEISTQCETENNVSEISTKSGTESHKSEITLKTFDEDITKPEVDEPKEAKCTKDLKISRSQVKDKKRFICPSRKISTVSNKSKESSINQQDKKRLSKNLNSSTSIDAIFLEKQRSLYQKHPSISKLKKIVEKFEKNEQRIKKKPTLNRSKPLSQDSFEQHHKHKNNEDNRLKKLKKVAKSISSSQSLLKNKYRKRSNMSTNIDKIVINHEQCDPQQETNLNRNQEQCDPQQKTNTLVPLEENSFSSNLKQFFTKFVNKNIIPLMSLQNDESSKIEDAKEKLLNMLFCNKNEGFDKLENMPDLNAALNFDYDESILNAKSDLNIAKLSKMEKKDDNGQKKKEEKDVQTESEQSSVQSNTETIEIVSLGSTNSNQSNKKITCCHNELHYLKTIMEVQPNDDKNTKKIEIKKSDQKSIDSNKKNLKRTGVKVNELKYSFSRKSSKDIINKYSQHKLGKGITKYSYKKTTIQNYVKPTTSRASSVNESKWKRITDKKLKSKNIPDELSMYKPRKKQDKLKKNNINKSNELNKELLKKYYKTNLEGYPVNVNKSTKHFCNKKSNSHKKQRNSDSSNFSFRDYITQQQALCETEIINILNMLNEKDGKIKNENDLKSDSRYWISNCHIKLLKSIEKLYTNDFESDTNIPKTSKFSQNVKEMIRSIENKGKNRNKNDIKTEHKTKKMIKNFINPKKEIQDNKKVTLKSSSLSNILDKNEHKKSKNLKISNEKIGDVYDQFNLTLNELQSQTDFKNKKISVEQNFSCLVTTDDKSKKHPIDSNQKPQEQNENPKEFNKIKINTKETKKNIEQVQQKESLKEIINAKSNKKPETKNGLFKNIKSGIREKTKKYMEQKSPKEVIKTKTKNIEIKNKQNVKIKNTKEIRENTNNMEHEQSLVKIEKKLNEQNNSKFKNIEIKDTDIKIVKNDPKVSKDLKKIYFEQSDDQKCVKTSNESKEIITENQKKLHKLEVMLKADKPKRVRPPLTVEDFEITDKNKSEISWSSIKQFDSIDILKTPINTDKKPKSLESNLDIPSSKRSLKEDQVKSDNYKQKSTVTLKKNKKLDNELEKMRQTRENYIDKINNALLDYEKQDKIKLFNGQFPDNHIKDFDILCDIHRNEIRAHKSYDQLSHVKKNCENFRKQFLQKSKSNIELSSDLSNNDVSKSGKSIIIDRTVKNINKKLNNMKKNQFSVYEEYKKDKKYKNSKFIDLEEPNKLKITKSQTNIFDSKRHIEDEIKKIEKNVQKKIKNTENIFNQDKKFQFRESLESIQFWRQLDNQQINQNKFLNEHKQMNEFKSRHKNIYSGPWAPSVQKETSFEYNIKTNNISSKGDNLKQELKNPLVLYNRQFDISSLKREWEIKLNNDQITKSSTNITEFDIYQKTITKWQMTPSIEEMHKKVISMKHSQKIGKSSKINDRKIHDKEVKKVRKGFTNFTMPVVVPRQQCIVAHSSTLRYFCPNILNTDPKTYPIKPKKNCEVKKLKSKIKNSLKIKKLPTKKDCEKKQELPSLSSDCLKLNELLKNKTKNLSKKTVKSFLKVLQDLSSSVQDHISLMKLALKKENLKLICKYSKSKSQYIKEKSRELYKHLISVDKSSKQKMCGDCDAATSTSSPKTMSLPAGQKDIKRSDSKFKVSKTTLEYIHKELITLKSQINQTLFAQVRNEIAVKTSMAKPELDTMLESIDSELDKIKTLEKQIDILIRELKQRIEVEGELDELHTRFEKDFVSKYEYESIKLSQDEALKKLKHETITETKTQLNEKLTEINELIQHQIQEQSRQEKARNNSEISLRKKLEHIGEVLQTELNNIQAVLSGNAADIKENSESIKEEMKSKDYSKRRNMFEKSTSIEEKTKGKSTSIEEKPKGSHKTETSPKHGGSVVKAKQSLEEKMNDDLKEKYLKKK